MSRVGQKPITMPDGVQASVADGAVKVKGARGELEIALPDGVTAAVEGNTITLARADDTRNSRSMHGLARSLVANAVEGVANGFSRQLVINGVGYRAEVQGQTVTLTIGYSSPVKYTLPEGVTVAVENNTDLTVSGYDKQKVGDAAARIRGYFPAEPYKGKGIQYKEERVRRKVGKTVA